MSKVQEAKISTATKKVAVSTKTNGVGRRKSSVARVWLGKGAGEIVVNGRKYEIYFDTAETRSNVIRPLNVCNVLGQFKIKVNVEGGGVNSQSGAVQLGIARALVKNDEALRTVLRANGLLTVDSRVKERKKPGQPGARRKFQFVKR